MLIVGAGVAGLAAIGTATSLGAVTYAFDVRPEVAEQIESMGAEFVYLDFEEQAQDGAATGGYAAPSSPKVDLVTTDGFLWPNAVLREKGLMERKGSPESYDVGALLRFQSGIKAGEHSVGAPLYSHLVYDVLPGETVTIDRPDILIFEGINVLQVRDLPEDGKMVPFVSDYFDFSIYIDAEESLIHGWYVDRFMRLRQTAFRDPKSFFHRYAELTTDSALAIAEGLWSNINLKNLKENIQPTRPRSDLILKKGANHLIEEVLLRKLWESRRFALQAAASGAVIDGYEWS